MGKKNSKKPIIEGRIKYDDKHKERMHPKLEEDLRERKHSLGGHPILPDSDEYHFEEKLISDRFGEVVRDVKKHFNIDEIDNGELINNSIKMIRDCINIESGESEELANLAIKMIREEYDIPEDMVDIDAELTMKINSDGMKLNQTPITVEGVEFDSHDDIQNANDEVYKRRFINVMNQGAAMRTNHMFHMVDEELTKINPTLPTKYGKLMSSADYMYFIADNIDTSPAILGGKVNIELPKNEGDKPKIVAQAITFPVLIHELVKGVMELISTHGLPENEKMREYVIGKADYLKAEPWDMRLGPGLWKKFVAAIPPKDFDLKHYVYGDFVKMPTQEFNSNMREVMAGTKQGKQIIEDIIANIKKDLQQENFDHTMNEKREATEKSVSQYIDNVQDLQDFWTQIGAGELGDQ